MLPSFRGLRKFFDGPELWDAGIYSRQDAKNAKLKEFFLGGGYHVVEFDAVVTNQGNRVWFLQNFFLGHPFQSATDGIAGLEGGNYDRVSLPTVKKVAHAIGTEIESKFSA